MVAKKGIILGTRGSPLALWQANFVKKLIQNSNPDLPVNLKIIKTTGDAIREKPLHEIGGKRLFLKEIEEALLAGTIDAGVHSMKDVPVDLPRGLKIGPILKREDPRDAFLSKKYDSLLQLPRKARVGTGALRRQAQLRNFRPDLIVEDLRGNVETRLRKLSGKLDAILLAAAGLIRLGLSAKITEYLPTTLMLPGIGQGAIGLEIREGDSATAVLVEGLKDIQTMNCLTAERSFLKALGGDCQSPIGGYAEINGMTLKLTGMVALPDGRDLIRDRVEGNIRQARELGEELAKALFQQGAREMLRQAAKK